MDPTVAAALLGPVVAAVIGLVVSRLDSRDERRRHVQATELGQKQIDFIRGWFDLYERVAGLRPEPLPAGIGDDLRRAYDQAIRGSAAPGPMEGRSLWKRFVETAFPPRSLEGGWSRVWRAGYWAIFAVSSAWVSILVALAFSDDPEYVNDPVVDAVAVVLSAALAVLLLYATRARAVASERTYLARRRAAAQELDGDPSIDPPSPSTPARFDGWFPAPDGPGQRYWDGYRWTEERRPELLVDGWGQGSRPPG
jgi:hypothetical protein